MRDDGTHAITPDLALVNVVFVGPDDAGDRGWTRAEDGSAYRVP